MQATLTISEVAAAAGLNTSAVRYYERAGVLPAPQRSGGQRRYATDTIDQLRTIRVAQQAGFSLDEIGQLLRGAADGRATDELRVMAERKLPEVEALIEHAEAMKRWLEFAAECRCGTLDACSLFEKESPANPLGLEAARSNCVTVGRS